MLSVVSSFQMSGVMRSRSWVVRIEAISPLIRSNEDCFTASFVCASAF